MSYIINVPPAYAVAHKLILWSPGGAHQGLLPWPPPLLLLHPPPHVTLPPLRKLPSLVTGRQSRHQVQNPRAEGRGPVRQMALLQPTPPPALWISKSPGGMMQDHLMIMQLSL